MCLLVIGCLMPCLMKDYGGILCCGEDSLGTRIGRCLIYAVVEEDAGACEGWKAGDRVSLEVSGVGGSSRC